MVNSGSTANASPPETNSEEHQMAEAVEEYKPKEREATAAQKKMLGNYVGSIKKQCDDILADQISGLKTGYLFEMKLFLNLLLQIRKFNSYC